MTRRETLPDLPGVVSAGQLRETVGGIASAQLPDGLLPWFPDHHADPWDHVEAAMALSLGGLLDEARAAFRWSARSQADDGSWPMEIVGGEVTDASTDANQCLYLAVGLWHHWLLTGDRSFIAELWPTVRRAADFALDLQRPDGAITWSRDPAGVPDPDALLTGSACMVLSLRCAMALADLVGDPHPDWELSAARLAHCVAEHPDYAFADKTRFSMDWYYPVLGGAVRGAAAQELLRRRWAEFVVPGRGIRCVADRPWVTAAETCELVLALDCAGDRAGALALLRDVQFLRAPEGDYWTGWVFPEQVVWPQQRTTWTAATVVLAADALARHSSANGLFRATDLPPLLDVGPCTPQCHALSRGQQ